MARIIELPWDSQPQEAVALNNALAPYVTAARNFIELSGWTIAGGSIVPTPVGVGYKGNGTSDAMSRATYMAATPGVWFHALFVHGTVSTAVKAVASIGSNAASSGSFMCVVTGAGSQSNIAFGGKFVDGGASLYKLGPVPVAGSVYSVVGVMGAASSASTENYIYVNGVKYTGNAAAPNDATLSTTGPNAYINEGVGALVRGTSSAFCDSTVISTAYGYGITEALAKELSLNPMMLWAPRRIWVPVTAAGGLPTLTALSPINVTATTALQRFSRA